MVIRPRRIAGKAEARAAFTLLEVLIVVAIVVVLAGVGGLTLLKYLEEARKDRCKIDMENITKAAVAYSIKHGSFPASLDVLTQGGAGLEANVLTNPWGQPYSYDPSGAHNAGQKPDVFTTAPDGEQIGNWMKK